MSTNKSLNYPDNRNMPPTTEVLDEDNFFIGVIFYISNKSKATTSKSTQSARSQTLSGQSHSIPMGPTSATKPTLVLKSM